MRFAVSYLIGLVPFAGLLIAFWLASRKREQTLKNPLTQKLLRPPGESLRRQLDTLNDQVVDRVLLAMAACFLMGMGGWIAFESGILGGFLILLGLTLFFATTLSLWKISAKLRDCHLGFIGERAVGEELNQLLASGWTVFHDIEFDDNPGRKPFNIDHIVIGPGGLFAIETKTRRKRVKRKTDDPKNEVIFNGSTLAYPWGEETFGINNAKDRASYLARWLKSTLGQEIPVQPVLALPGWSVIRRGRGPVWVVSGREASSLFRDEQKKQVLDPKTVKSITALVELKCRDVE